MTSTHKRIRDIREDSDLLQKEVADAIDVSISTYRRYEAGTRLIPHDKIIELSVFYNLSADYILGLTDKPRKLK